MEIWKDIPNYEGLYQVSNLGRIKSLKREANNQYCKDDTILKVRKHKNGYCFVALYKNGKSKEISIHRIVATSFLENSNNYPSINHINGNKEDNRIENLEWCSPSHNTKEAFRIGLMKPNYKVLKENSKRLSIGVLQIDKLTKKVIKEWDSMKEAEDTLKIKTHINEVISGRRKSASGFLWRRKEVENG